MVVDTGCPENVAGIDWYKCYTDCLSEEQKSCIKQSTSDNKFRFGKGPVFLSLFSVELPIVVSGVTILFKFDVVDTEVPLLLGKQTMKDWKLIIDTGNETASMLYNGVLVHVELRTAQSNHWCIEIAPNVPTTEILSMFSVKELSKKEKSSAAAKIHRQFCHLPFEFLKKVLKFLNPDDVDEEFLSILETYSESCEVCQKYKPTPPKPCVGNLMAPEKMNFNEMVSIDLKHRNSKLIMYMIDCVTRFTRATFVRNKEKETIVDSIIKTWMCIFGAANTFLMDNGGEFANDVMRELGNHYGISIKHTAAYAPWANGINERNHYTVDMMMDKMLEENPTLSEDTALQYAICIRNCSMFVNGFTPAQLVFGGILTTC